MIGEQKPFAKLKGDDKKWAIESAASTLKEYGRISKEPELIKAAQALIEEQAREAEEAANMTKSFVNKVNSKSPAFQTKE